MMRVRSSKEYEDGTDDEERNDLDDDGHERG